MNADEPADLDLLRLHVDGDETAFGRLVRRHQDRMWAVALRTLGDPDEAADAVQEAMIKAFRGASSFRGDAAVTTWLHRIVVNACLDRARRRAARPIVPLADDLDRAQPVTAGPPQDPALAQEQRTDVLAALRVLPPEQRAAVVLVDMEGYPVDEAAQILGCAPGTIKSRCSRARRRLAPLLAAWNPEPPADVVPDAGADITHEDGGGP